VSHATYKIGDVFAVMADMPDNSVDLVLTSPPFLALRSYLPADHPNKHLEIGSEPTPAEFLDTLLALTAEWERLLAPHGSIAVELGDTYAGTSPTGAGWPLDKSLCIIPELYAASLAYGRNILTGEPSPTGQWRVRNLVRWVRPNPPVGALGDKYRPATSVMVVACKARDRWFDLDDVRTEPAAHSLKYDKPEPVGAGNPVPDRADGGRYGGTMNPAGAPPLDWWNIPTESYKGSHYATWPRKVCEIPIRSMCPRHVCNVCGEPRRRMVEANYVDANGAPAPGAKWGSGIAQGAGAHSNKTVSLTSQPTTLGWTDCGHDDYRLGVVLDPFAGSGTTLAVATGHGRDAIGIDLDARNADLAAERVGMFLTVEGG
jgi:site-specific DNA-methyltransferase (adenine-specific)